jgi:CDP-4-dehydro-6-deoxyglucose reductase, E3
MPTAPETFETRLVGSRLIAPAVRELVLERTDGKPFLFEPGQWLNLMLDMPDGQLKRAYSIASEPTGSPRFELAVTRVTGGPASVYLHELAQGTVLRAVGPYGLFTREGADAAPSLFVATGTGVTPLRSMMRAARAVSSPAPLWLLFGARCEDDILYRQEFEELARSHGGRYEITLSQPSPAWTGRRGYVQAHVPELWRELAAKVAPAQADVYICGLQRMVQSVKELAQGELGVPRKHVHIERYD